MPQASSASWSIGRHLLVYNILASLLHFQFILWVLPMLIFQKHWCRYFLLKKFIGSYLSIILNSVALYVKLTVIQNHLTSTFSSVTLSHISHCKQHWPLRKGHFLLHHSVPRITEHLASLSPSTKCQENLSYAVTTYMSTNFRDGDRTSKSEPPAKNNKCSIERKTTSSKYTLCTLSKLGYLGWSNMLCSTLTFFIVFFFFFCWLEYSYFLSRKPISLSTSIDTVPFRNSSLATLTRDHFWFCFWLAYFIVCFEPSCVHAPSLPCWIICSLLTGT